MKFSKEKLIDNIILFVFTIIIFLSTYVIKFDNLYKSIYIFNFLIKNNGIKYLVISYLIVFMLFIIVKSIVGDNLKTVIISTIISLLITVISYYKFKVLELPFLPCDIFLIKNIGQISTFGVTFLPILTIILILIIIFMIILYKIIRKKYYKKSKVTLKNDWYRIPLFILGIFLLYYLCIMPERFNKLSINSNLYNAYTWMGANPAFFMHIGDFIYIPPKDYTKNNIDNIKNETQENDENTKEINKNSPNVIFIMNESYSNPNKIKNVTYSIDPMSEINTLTENNSNCKIGNVVSPVLGGGTSVPEFEALTGLSSYFIEKQISPYTSYIRSNMNSIVRLYNNNDYTTIGVHPYSKNFYNRKNVYSYLGFHKTVFEEEMEKPEYKGDNISDNEFANQIINQYRQTEGKKFIFGVTMQNHMPYNNKQYENYDIYIKQSNLIETDNLTLRNYIQGVYDSNKMFLKLVDYLKEDNEPTVLIMFGDHLPPLLNYSLYHNSEFEQLDFYETPYIIWTNYNTNLDNIPDYLCPNNLSLNILNICDIDLPWYLKKFKTLYDNYKVINNQLIYDKNSNVLNTQTIKDSKIINECLILQYDLLIKKKYIPIE